MKVEKKPLVQPFKINKPLLIKTEAAGGNGRTCCTSMCAVRVAKARGSLFILGCVWVSGTLDWIHAQGLTVLMQKKE